MLKAEHVAAPLGGTVGTAQIAAVLTSRVSHVNPPHIVGELDYKAVEVTYSQGK